MTWYLNAIESESDHDRSDSLLVWNVLRRETRATNPMRSNGIEWKRPTEYAIRIKTDISNDSSHTRHGPRMDRKICVCVCARLALVSFTHFHEYFRLFLFSFFCSCCCCSFFRLQNVNLSIHYNFMATKLVVKWCWWFFAGGNRKPQV